MVPDNPKWGIPVYSLPLSRCTAQSPLFNRNQRKSKAFGNPLQVLVPLGIGVEKSNRKIADYTVAWEHEEAKLYDFGINSAFLGDTHKLWLSNKVVPILVRGGSITLVGEASRSGKFLDNDELIQCLDLGDLIGVDGTLRRTQTGELSIISFHRTIQIEHWIVRSKKAALAVMPLQ